MAKGKQAQAETASYEDILDAGWDAIPTPQTLPNGSYILKGKNASLMEANGKVGQRVVFFYSVKEPMDDVSQAELEELGPDYEYGMNQTSKTFWIEDVTSWDAIKKHLQKHAGVKFEGSIRETLKNGFRGSEVVGFLEQRSYEKDGEMVTVSDAKAFTPLG